jgi:hypothetical protein
LNSNEEAIKPLAALGPFGAVIPEEYGGVGMGWLEAMIITEEIARASSSLRVQINMQDLGCTHAIRQYGSEDAVIRIHPKARIGRADRGLCDYRGRRRLRRQVDEVGRQRQTRPLAAERLEDLDLEC